MESIQSFFQSEYSSPIVMFIISFFTSMGGVSGAFLLPPYQLSILGIVSPSISATSHLYNVLAIPGGLWNYIKDSKMLWHLTAIVVLGTLPGVFVGAIIRLEYLPDPENFKFFAGLVLLYLGYKMLVTIIQKKEQKSLTGVHKVEVVSFRIKKLVYRFEGQEYSVPNIPIFIISLIVGVVGGVYGIGGGAIIAPIYVAFFGLPIYTVAGAALMGTFATSLAAVFFFQFLSGYYPEMAVAPNWTLGLLLGIGGLLGIFFGSKYQRRFPQKFIKVVLTICILFIAIKYIIGFFV